MSRLDYRLDDDRELELECPRHRGEPENGCESCAEEIARECDMCGGTGLVTVEVAAYRTSVDCHCTDENVRPEPVAAE